MAILISTPQDLDNIRNNLTGDYELANDIDMSSFGNFTPIGTSSTPFTGTFDGKGHKIKNLTISVSFANVGLFGYVNNATTFIKNLGVENCNFTSNNFNYVGAIAGYLLKGNITNCYSTGQLSGQYGIGGLVGYSNGLIENSFSHANVTGKGRVGGILGNGISTNAVVNNCYATGLITVTPDPNVYNGGLVGSHTAPTAVTNSYWDINTSGQTISAGGEGKTTTEMKTQSTYTNWDFTTVWGINSNYPYLQVFGVPAAPPKIETITVNSYVHSISSGLNKYGKVSKRTESFLRSISNELIRKSRTERNVSTYLSPIDSNVQKSNRTVRNSTQNIHTFIRPISSSIYRESKTIKNLLAYIKPIQARTDVLYPLNINIPTSYVNIQENDSVAYKMENMSTISYIINPSNVEVIK